MFLCCFYIYICDRWLVMLPKLRTLIAVYRNTYYHIQAWASPNNLSSQCQLSCRNAVFDCSHQTEHPCTWKHVCWRKEFLGIVCGYAWPTLWVSNICEGSCRWNDNRMLFLTMHGPPNWLGASMNNNIIVHTAKTLAWDLTGYFILYIM